MKFLSGFNHYSVQQKIRPIALAVLSIGLISCGGSSDSSTNNTATVDDNFTLTTSQLKVYKQSTAFNAPIAACVTKTECTLEQLPLIGQRETNPSISTIMEHVVVSHDWMGQRFEQFLQAMPSDILKLLGSVTAIVISNEVRPSHYRGSTGAIYLDPATLWINDDERKTISVAPDFRSEFGANLQFDRLWRYTIADEYAWQSYSLTEDTERSFNDAVLQTTWLLFHELAHANDCMQSSAYGSLNKSATFSANFDQRVALGECTYQILMNESPLQSDVWYGLANVLYQGADSTAEQNALSPYEVADHFSLDIANDTYSYSSPLEDVAMAFEAVMMKLHFNAERDMAFVAKFDTFSCEGVQVKWGQRNRLAQTEVWDRAKRVTQIMLPSIDLTSLESELNTATNSVTQIPTEQSWCELSVNDGAIIGKQQMSNSAYHAAKSAQDEVKYERFIADQLKNQIKLH
ncbi:hypothetical protein [Flocculibacter collagenilyticus]|uniref:hypothetical protein n=1 Tax=Flocculibacter collagenilyticus TaxID=2744479 RepID=UPI0018F59ED8|nr:hypothetical protein [Flocculibacter collagenilyticus]